MQDGAEDTALGFLELMAYCANKCQSRTVILCNPVAQHLYKLAGTFHEVTICLKMLGASHSLACTKFKYFMNKLTNVMSYFSEGFPVHQLYPNALC